MGQPPERVIESKAADITGGPLLLRVPAAAQLLSVTPKTCYRWIAEGVIPRSVILRVGEAMYVRAEALRKWAEGKR